MYAADIKGGRPSIASEKLLRAMLIEVLYSVRSERQLMEQTKYNLLFRWFIGLAMDDAMWVPPVFSKREHLIERDAVIEFFNQIVEQAQEQELLSGEHFSVDGTLIQAWAGHKSSVRKDCTQDDDTAGNFTKTKNAATTPMNPPRTEMYGFTARARLPASCASWATRSPTTAMDWWSVPWPPRPMATQSAKRPRP